MKKEMFTLFISLIFSVSYGQVVNGSFLFEGDTRTYSVYLPSGFQQSQSLPLLLALHGYTQTGQTMMTFSGFNQIADTAGFVVVYPDGVGNAWNVGFSGGSTANDVGFLMALTDSLHNSYNIDYSRVYATGFSNGGFMSYRLACEVPEKIAAIAPVAGTMTNGSASSCAPGLSVPVMHIHGTSDFVVSYNGGFGNLSAEQVVDLWNGFNDCPAQPTIENLPDIVAEGSTVQRYTWAPCNDDSKVVLLKIINGGHTWPGSVGVTGIGITNRDINAGSEIWNFVKHYSRPLLTSASATVDQYTVVYPNPLQGNILRIESGEKWEIAEMYDLSGRLISNHVISDKDAWYQIPELAPGMFFLILKNEKKQETIKLISR
ncbi:PHB depolymerase family esterase [Lentimicrobium sp.]|uniref:extracellular catalytic domain type 1 short-chain-length polyhydroxyalkanoate depolymerase n=1 Tax=Lentimicrobium sp. TaxID=2034841 RepID=UPI0025FBD3B8|nr:PHB depolymerase family esterase [Lentimicrobium sp.]MCO5255292.1 T9SS type A sorting domain-containing protein [Lentimicrobium sp.]MCO5263554.1 T9SS type A sorting domain-containing protein [Lentimicrobium sp.]HOP14157.1 PHB depolymerase family esterase [Lentimicrobium sp.]HPF64491.1 PHB depolymerase family esterase [Lentimicrobium sp.]HPR26083.1 PHB depolymerase family esterase [Lentimicrobium sp.]